MSKPISTLVPKMMGIIMDNASDIAGRLSEGIYDCGMRLTH
jgi:hypothetical protein